MTAIEKHAANEQWREKYIYPLERMFRNTGVFFTINVFDQDRVLLDIAEYRKELVGEYSTKTRMAHFVSPEASELYHQMLKDPIPYPFIS